jgi:hypothetical protein
MLQLPSLLELDSPTQRHINTKSSLAENMAKQNAHTDSKNIATSICRKTSNSPSMLIDNQNWLNILLLLSPNCRPATTPSQ